MDSEVFDTYEREYQTLSADLKDKITNAIPSATPEQRKLLVNQATRELEEADEIMGQMEVELMSLAQGIRNKLSPKLRQFKDQVKTFKKELDKIKSTSERDALLGSHGSNSFELESKSMDQRARLIQGTERLQDGSRRLEDAQRIALETESIGISTLEDLNRQREQMTRTRDTLTTADQWIGRSQGVLKSMHRRMQANKLITAGIIVLLSIIILAIIYLKWFSS